MQHFCGTIRGRTKRYIKTANGVRHGWFLLSLVRKHRAPKGGLRRRRGTRLGRRAAPVRKPRAQKGALRLPPVAGRGINPDPCQKAPNSKRCIKTQRGRQRHRRSFPRVRKHRAPKGALRPAELVPCALAANQVRKHRAPKGALRPRCISSHSANSFPMSESTERQKVH